MVAEGALELSEHLGKSKVVPTFTAIVEGKNVTEVSYLLICGAISVLSLHVRLTTTFSFYEWALVRMRVQSAPAFRKLIDLGQQRNLI